MSVKGDDARRDELIAEVFASRVALYDGQGVAENIDRKACLGLFAENRRGELGFRCEIGHTFLPITPGMGPRIARVKLAPYHRVAPSRHGLVPLGK